MAVYRPKRNGVESRFYVYEFMYQCKRFQGSTGATSKTVAKEYEKRRRAELERAAAGLPTDQKSTRIKTVADVVKPYLAEFAVNHRPMSTRSAKGCLANVERLLGGVILSDLTDDRIKSYMRKRQAEAVSGRTINMEIGELSRAIGSPWSLLWPKVRKLEERKDVGRALSPEEQQKILDALPSCAGPLLRTLIPLLLMTGMRKLEALSMTWGQVDLIDRSVAIGRAKTSSGTGRVLPLNDDMLAVLIRHREWFVEKFGEPAPGQYLFPYGSPLPVNPARAVGDVKHAWESLRKTAGVPCRLHDLRHTFATRLAENGASESTMLALMGHMSRAMLERYSHIRLSAKRDAVAGIRLHMEKKAVLPVIVPVATIETDSSTVH